MSAADAGAVVIGARTYHVAVVSETVARTVYRVLCTVNPSRSWRPAEVIIGAESVFTCLRCKRHPSDPCIHVTVAQRFVAAQPAEVL